jgi:superfamily II RNA helicase
MVKLCSLIYPQENEEMYKQYYGQFKYPLHDFQKWSIESTVEQNHTLVCAPTGTGKSLCAEFAIDFFHSKGKKSIYCSPIKSLSNQKFYDFTQKYPHISVGLITGDIKTNPNADVLIMTTEILLNKLYQIRSASHKVNTATSFDMDIETELACVIFDEIHMIGDRDRGQVWENSIMMLPNHIQIIGLSATLDDPEKFAQWIEQAQGGKKTVYLAKKMDRPVPLTHYSFITVNSGIFKSIKDKSVHAEIRSVIDKPFVIQSANGVFNEEHYGKMTKMLKLFEMNSIKSKRPHVINQVTKHLVENEMLPALCYVFSRKQLEICARELTTPLLEFDSKVPYTIHYDCEQIIRKLPNYQEYLHLPEYVNLVDLLRKGIGIHHAGMMPILREIVEILFARGSIKMLFCTTSVAIGLNLPVKTCIFTDVCKHDGNHVSILQGHEYVQAAGRSGRLGIDTVGNVIHLNNLFRNVDYTSYKTMLKGKPQILTSKFKISFNLLLNLIDIGDTDFNEFSNKSMIKGDLDSELKNTRLQIDTLHQSIEKSSVCIRTPIETVKEYINLLFARSSAVNKKRKEIERQIQTIVDNYKFIESDKVIVQTMVAKESELNVLMRQERNIQTYLENNVQIVLDLLKEEGFLQDNETLTQKGRIASKLRETHCLVFANLIENGQITNLTSRQLIMLFSCFTNVSVAEDLKQNIPKCSDKTVEAIVYKTHDMYKYYMNREFSLYVNSGIDYNIHFDLLDYVSKWCDCECVEDCKILLQTVEREKSIFLGEFCKAVLKIINISCEMESVAEQMGNLEFLSVLKEIPKLTMKYVVTNQSLYV